MSAAFAVGNLAGVITIRAEDAVLTAELQAGSEEAFALLIAQYHAQVYSLVSHLLTDPSDAPDITQDVFIKVFRGIHSFHGDSSLRTWIYRIALREASNERRWWSRHRGREVTIEREAETPAWGNPIALKDLLVDQHDSPFEAAAQQEIRSRVEAELRQLPEPYRAVVILRDLEGMAYDEIAEVLGAQLGTVKSRLVRGRTMLRERLADFIARAQERPAAGGRQAGAVCRGGTRCLQGGGVIRCHDARSQFSHYLDGTVSGAKMHAIAAHLEGCAGCAMEFASWRQMQRMLSAVGPARPPADLGLRLRVAISQERARTTRHRLDIWQMRWQNTMAPILARGAAGLATAIILLGTVALMIGTVAAPPTVAANESVADRTSTPRFLYTVGASDSRVTFRNPVVVQADISETGRVYAYRILSGPQTRAVREQLDNFLLMSHFTPAQFYGMPVPGHAVLSFSSIYRHRG